MVREFAFFSNIFLQFLTFFPFSVRIFSFIRLLKWSVAICRWRVSQMQLWQSPPDPSDHFWIVDVTSHQHVQSIVPAHFAHHRRKPSELWPILRAGQIWFCVVDCLDENYTASVYGWFWGSLLWPGNLE